MNPSATHPNQTSRSGPGLIPPPLRLEAGIFLLMLVVIYANLRKALRFSAACEHHLWVTGGSLQDCAIKLYTGRSSSRDPIMVRYDLVNRFDTAGRRLPFKLWLRC